MLTYSLYQTTGTGADPGVQNGVAASSTNTYYSATWDARGPFGLTVFTTGTLTGTWTLWGTDKINPSLADDADWVDMSTHAEFVETNPAGSTSKWQVSSTLIRKAKLRLKYVNASGTGTLYAYATPMCG
jgi:hypothetical protein